MLGKQGFDVEFAADGGEAIAKLAAASFQAVFLDCDLPGMSGVEVARRFRASERAGGRALIVATTAFSTVGVKDACLAAGMDAFLAKPITPEKLGRALAGQGGSGPEPAPGPIPEPAPSGGLAVDLEMIRHLSDGSPEGLGLELAKFIASLDEALLEAVGARGSGSRAAVSSAAHRVLSHARMVGATALAGTAADLQDYASVYTDSELAWEVEALRTRSAELKEALARIARTLRESP